VYCCAIHATCHTTRHMVIGGEVREKMARRAPGNRYRWCFSACPSTFFSKTRVAVTVLQTAAFSSASSSSRRSGVL